MSMEKEIEKILKSDETKKLIKKVSKEQTKLLHEVIDKAWERGGFLK